MPADILGVNFEQKLFRPTELDRAEGPVFCRRIFRTSGIGSPLHTSYRKGKSFYRGSWLRERGLSNIHWFHEIPHPPRRYEEPLVHHYMIDDEDSFVRKMKRLEVFHPNIHDASRTLRRQAFKLEWLLLYAKRGEAGLRDHYRAEYLIKADKVPGHLARGELVQDATFADFKLQQLGLPTAAARM